MRPLTGLKPNQTFLYMKKFALVLAFIASSLVLTPSISEARDHGRGHHHDSRRVAYRCRDCGSPVYQERYFAGRDRHGHPSFGWRTISHRHPRGHGHHHGHDHGRDRGPSFSGAGFRIDIRR